MLTILISALAGLVLGLGLSLGGAAHWGWSVLWGLLGFGACQAGAGLLLRGRVKRLMDSVQGTLAAGQKRL